MPVTFVSCVRSLHLLDPVLTDVRPIDVFVLDDCVLILAFVILIIVRRLLNLVMVVNSISRTEHVRSVRRSLIRTNDELAQEFVAQTVEVAAVEFRIRALFEVRFWSIVSDIVTLVISL